MPAIKKVWEKDKESAIVTAKIEFMRDVSDGTQHMRAVGQKKDYLPKFPSESDDDYKTRKKISVFEPFTADAVQTAKGKVFAKKIKQVDLPSEFETLGIMDNFDRNGTSFDEFAEELCEIQTREGIVFVYTAFPGTREQRPVPSKLIRPYARIVTGDSIVSKKFTTKNGTKILHQVVISESVNQDDGDYQQSSAQQYRRIYLDKFDIKYVVYREGAERKEIIVESGEIRIAGQKTPQIPLEPCYGIKKRYFFGVSPFEELGYLNIQHYQKSSDYDMSLHRCGAATPVISGDKVSVNPIKDAAEKQQTNTGGPEIMHLEADGDFKWVSGSSEIKPMADDIERKEERMKAMGFDVIDGGNKTATQINDERTDKEAKLNNLSKNLENCLNRTLQHMADYLNIQLGDGKVIVNNDFNLTVMPIEDFKTYGDLVSQGIMTLETFYNEAQAGERLLTMENAEDEIEKLDEGIEE